MRRIFVLVAVLGAIVGALVAAGMALPRDHVAASTIALRQPPDTVWAVLRDLGGVSDWWSEVSEAALVPNDAEGREVWRYTMQDESVLLLVVESTDPPERLVTRIDAAPGAGFGGAWVYEVFADGSGCRLTVTEQGWIANPVFRVLARFVFGYHRTIDSYLAALGRRFGELTTPMHES